MAKKVTVKKTAKKPAKKAVAKPKLIDGLYSHKFTIRFLPEEGEVLERLQKHFNQKAYSKTIMAAMRQFERVDKENTERKYKIDDLQGELRKLKYSVSNFKEAFNELMEEPKPKTVNKTIYDHDDEPNNRQLDIDDYCEECGELHEDCEC